MLYWSGFKFWWYFSSLVLSRWLDYWMFSLLKSHWIGFGICKFPFLLNTNYKSSRCVSKIRLLSSSLPRSYLVMPFMGTDLSKLMKLERLSEDRVQFLVYQMLKGLKVNTFTNTFTFIGIQTVSVRSTWISVNILTVISNFTQLMG